jgi:DNA-binding response OmpR family regulator
VITSDSHPSSLLLLGGAVTEDPRLAERLHSEGLSFRRASWAALGTSELEAVDALVVDQSLEHHVEEVLAVVSLGHLPVVLLLPSVEPAERIAWLERGLDEVLSWPTAAQELCLRLRTLVRRSRRLRELAEGVIRVGGLELRLETRRARLDGRLLPLTDYEFRLLSVLARRSGSAVTREQLLELAKGSAEESFDRSIDVRVSRLRSKLSDDPRHPRLLKTVRGVGYVLVARTM